MDSGTLILAEGKGRLFAFIDLLPKNAKRKREVDLTGFIDTRTGEVIKGRTGGGDILPLECGRWHFEKFLKRGKIQSSRLIYEERDFYFAATFEFESRVRQPVTYLGVDRGIENLAAWAVIDGEGNRLVQGTISGERLRSVQRREEGEQRETQRQGRIYRSRTRRAIADEEVHKSANAIVEVAVKQNARVVMEDLKTISQGPHQRRPKGARRGGW